MARRRRTSIRTAAGTTQERFRQRIKELADDPLRVLPECPGGEPAPIARLRSRLERVAAGKAGLLDKRDKGVLGAVVQSLKMGDETVPRLLDDKVEGNRRFFLTRGQVKRLCLLGVQNHDDPRALMLAYVPMARKHDLHLFAMPRLWCTAKPQPPDAWWDAFAEKTGLQLEPDDGRTCPHRDRARLELGFPGGASLRVCSACSARSGHVHRHLATRYRGPASMTVRVRMPDGSTLDVDEKDERDYLAGSRTEGEVLEKAIKGWHAAAAGRFRLGERDFGTDQDAFLDALDPPDWERAALAAMTKGGHAGPMDTAANIIDAHADALVAGVQAVLGDETGAARFIADHDVRPREVVRLAHEEAARRQRTKDLPDPPRLGRIGAWVHGTVRAVRREGTPAGLERARKALDANAVPPAHLYAFMHALGGSLDLEIRFRPDEKEAGRSLQPRAEALLAASGDAYLEALRDYLRESGSGESV